MQKKLWFFNIIDRGTKEARVFYVMDNSRKENLIPIVVKNILLKKILYKELILELLSILIVFLYTEK